MIRAQSVGVEAHFDPRIFAKSRKIMTLLKRAAKNIPHRNIMSSDFSRCDVGIAPYDEYNNQHYIEL